MRAASSALLLALLAGGCAGPGEDARPVEAAAVEGSAERAAAGQVQFGIVVAAGEVPAGPTADYPHWDAHGAWAVPPEAIWTLEQPLLTCRVAVARRSIDAQGFPAVDVALAPADGARFQELSRRSVGRRLAVLVDGRVVLTPRIAEALPPRFQLAGRFSEEDVRALLEHLRPPAGD
jgi:hypothetical protein